MNAVRQLPDTSLQQRLEAALTSVMDLHHELHDLAGSVEGRTAERVALERAAAAFDLALHFLLVVDEGRPLRQRRATA